MSPSIKVILVDDELALLRAWARLFAIRGTVNVVETLGRVSDLKGAIATYSPDVVVMDLSMPGENPLAELPTLRASEPHVRFLVYSGHNDQATIRSAHAAGADGYVDKLAPPEEMVEAIQRVARGEKVFPEWLAGARATR